MQPNHHRNRVHQESIIRYPIPRSGMPVLALRHLGISLLVLVGMVLTGVAEAGLALAATENDAPKTWVLFSSRPGQPSGVHRDDPTAGLFAVALRQVAESSTLPIGSLAELHDKLADAMLSLDTRNRQQPDLRSDRLLAPLCPAESSLRVRILAIDFEHIATGGDVVVQRAAWSKLCPDPRHFTVHAGKIGKAEIGAILEAALEDARQPSGTSLFIVSGAGGQIGGTNRVLLSDASMGDQESAVAGSFSADALIARIEAACQSRCGVLVDAGRQPLDVPAGTTR